MLIWTARSLWTNDAGYSVAERERTDYGLGTGYATVTVYVVLAPESRRSSSPPLSEHADLGAALHHCPEGRPEPREYHASDLDAWRPGRWRLLVKHKVGGVWHGFASYAKDGDMNQAILHSPDLTLVEAQNWCQDVFDLLRRTFDFTPGWTNR